MQIAFVMPTEEQKLRIKAMHAAIGKMRPDQSKYFEQLVRSWRLIERWDALRLTERAIRRTFHERP